MQLSSVDIKYIISELQPLIGAKVDQIYAYTPKLYCLQLHNKGKPKSYLFLSIPFSIGLNDKKLPNPLLTPFVTYLRKYIKSTFIKSISQHGFNRIIKIETEFKDKLFNIYIELFDKGNIILTDKDDKILNVLEQQRWEKRSISPNMQYEFPHEKIPQFKSFTETDPISKVLAQSGLGGFYANVICDILEIDPQTKANDISPKHINETINKITTQPQESYLLTEIKNGKNKERPIPFKHAGAQLSKTPFSQNCIADELIIKTTKRLTKTQKERIKLQKIIDTQVKQSDNLKEKAAEYRAIGEKVKSNAFEVDTLIKQYLKGEYTPVKEDKKKKTITVELK